MRISGIAWDIDGTLVDSEPRHLRALLRASALWGVDLSDLPDETFQGVHVAYLDWLEAINDGYLCDREEMPVVPGALEAMQLFAGLGLPQICVSNSSRSVVDANIRGLGISDTIIGSISLDDVTNGKPDAEPYAKACAALGVDNRNVVAIEDSATGLRSAISAGLITVALTRDPAVASLADFSLHDLRVLPPLLGQYLHSSNQSGSSERH
jgi:beta-phosphoglucomutase-like phosphatase (HAD superfamily)